MKRIFDEKKIKEAFDLAIQRLKERDTEKLIKSITNALEGLSFLEQIILLSHVASEVYQRNAKELNDLENLEAVSYTIFSSIQKAFKDLYKIVFIIGRMGERIVNLNPEVKKQIEKEVLKAIKKQKTRPGYIA